MSPPPPGRGARRPRPPGFTLIELMVTLAVAAIVLTVGIPSFREFIERNRVSAHTNLLVSALQLARSEAIKRGGHLVILCKGDADGNVCGAENAWNAGLLLFADINDDKLYTAGTDILIQTYAAAPKLTISTTGTKYDCWVGYGSNGYPVAGGSDCADELTGNGTFTLCPSDTSSNNRGRNIVINSNGRIRTEDATC